MEQLIQQVETLLRPSTEVNAGDDTGDSRNGGSADGAGSSSDSMGSQSSPPSIQEVMDAIAALRDASAAGADNIVAPLFKANSTMAEWLHRVIFAVWMSGKAPLDWKRALIMPLGHVRLSWCLHGICFCAVVALRAVSGPGFSVPRSLNWSGGCLAGHLQICHNLHNDP